MVTGFGPSNLQEADSNGTDNLWVRLMLISPGRERLPPQNNNPNNPKAWFHGLHSIKIPFFAFGSLLAVLRC
jgi:hypothetical protein